MAGEGGGVIGWFVRHRVAPNLLMLVFLLGGLYMTTRITQEVFPDFQRDVLVVSVSYPGATPEQIESGVVLPVEEAVQGLEGVEKITATARTGSGRVNIELIEGYNLQRAYQDVTRAVDDIDTFPDQAEDPEISFSGWRRDVLDMLVYGDVPEHSLRAAAERVRDRLRQTDGVTQAALEDVRDYEIHIDVSEAQLRTYGLTLQDVAAVVAENSRDRSAGRVETAGGDILLKVGERLTRAEGFRDIVLRATPGGGVVRLSDVADVSEAFATADEDIGSYDGKPAVGVEVFRVGRETPIGVSDAVHRVLPEIRASLPPQIGVAIRSDASSIYSQRVELLLGNAFLGLLLVLAVLSAFLELRLAFWVTVGIPTAFLGAFLFLPWFGVSINMISLFAFIIALGIVVDDAIVAGENIYEYRQRGLGLLPSAVQGARDIAVPIVMSVLTNIVAFLPLAFIPGTFGQIWAVIPAVVGTVFAISLVEALIILPAHLGHTRSGASTGAGATAHRLQQRFSAAFSRFIDRGYGGALALAVRWRYVTLGLATALLAVTLAYAASGRMGFILMPRVESDTAEVTAVLPQGAPATALRRVRDTLVAAAGEVVEGNGGDALSDGVYAAIDGNEVEVRVYMTPPERRPMSTGAFVQRWREVAGAIPGVESTSFDADRGGPGGGAAVTVQLSHGDIETLNHAAATLAERLGELAYVRDVDDGYQLGSPEWTIRLTDSGRALGFTVDGISRQLRNGFYGAEAVKLLRGASEVTVRVQLPPALADMQTAVSSFMLRTDAGRYVPLESVAEVSHSRAVTSIQRENGRRAMPVTADVVPIEQTNRVLRELRERMLPRLVADFPGLSYEFGGRQESMRDAIQSFFQTVTIALLGIFALLALPFRSYIQPMIVMMAIPFGVVGAILGHLIMGYSLSIISIMGIIALGGVVVNGSLVMIDYANARVREGASVGEAVHAAGVRRFRPIMLTTLTTFGGLAPMIFETSMQARFMIPMAISLGYGIVFSSAILLFLIPCLYLAIEDVRALLGGRRTD
ncbi:efflux RND transporter permease subunit [Arhodomonas sp. KWT2]|uniref:efflux RND transporter permease subunit n=2 Tax=unclassified Arhodomonas TaxID=2621637 RepID=UPI0035C231E7